jgi:hypothetical protein
VSIVVLVLGILLALAACAESGTGGALRSHGGDRTAVSAPPSGPLQLAQVISLNTARVVGGEPLSGALVVSNPGSAIDLSSHGCRPGFVVVLTNSSYSPSLGFPAICVGGAFVIPHGTTRLPVSVVTTYIGCLERGEAAPGLPPCLASGKPPPLPPGAYKAQVEWEITVPLPPAQPVVVTVAP